MCVLQNNIAITKPKRQINSSETIPIGNRKTMKNGADKAMSIGINRNVLFLRKKRVVCHGISAQTIYKKIENQFLPTFS